MAACLRNRNIAETRYGSPTGGGSNGIGGSYPGASGFANTRYQYRPCLGPCPALPPGAAPDQSHTSGSVRCQVTRR